ncbi:hypothetical protein CO044_01325 [Candidatus Peregrinibacteria bacterium CG_4_9_14_0_2_um_filter_38_9]|nr:MAG: hypothetical protein CO044_01325 [Candidatus Peregrinibacteria bacterium CG_4_9_14_0_2_um_filter_38_9]
MFEGRYVFSQIIDFIPRDAMEAYIKKYHGNKKIRELTCRDQFLALMFGQLTGLRSLRGIVLCLNVHSSQFYHLGFRAKSFTLSTLSRANQFRDWQIWRDFTEHLIVRAKRLYAKENDFSIELKNSVYALDSKTLTAYIGLDSRVYESGTSIKGKGYISKRGSKILRTRFYNAASVAVLHENIFREFFLKKRSEGKPYRVALCAVMHKMVHVVYAVSGFAKIIILKNSFYLLYLNTLILTSLYETSLLNKLFSSIFSFHCPTSWLSFTIIPLCANS